MIEKTRDLYWVFDIEDSQWQPPRFESYEEALLCLKRLEQECPNSKFRILGGHLGWTE